MPRHSLCLLAFSLCISASTVLAAGQGSVASSPKSSAIKVNGVTIPADRIELAVQGALIKGIQDSPELREALRAQLVSQEVLRQAALKLKLQNHPLVVEARKQAETEAMAQIYLRQEVKPEPVSEAEVRARYEAIVSTLGDKEYKLRLIALTDKESATQILERLRKGESFDALARKHSVLPSAALGGAMEWVSFKLPAEQGKTQGVPVPLANLAATLPVGALPAEPLVADGRFYLVRVDEVRPTKVPDYATVKPQLRQLLEGQALEKATARLMGRLIGAARIE